MRAGYFAAHHFRILMLAIALGLSGALAWNAYERAHPTAPARSGSDEASAPTRPSPAALATRRAEIETLIGGSQVFAGFLARLKQSFPADWNRILDTLARQGATPGENDNAANYISDILRIMRRDRGIVASRAGPEAMASVFEAQARLLSTLAAVDKRVCVDFLVGQASPAFLDLMGRNAGQLADLANATLGAIVDGGARKIVRDAPSDADFDLLAAALTSRGLGKVEIEVLLDGRLPDPPLPDATLCDAGLVYFEALKSLPEGARGRMYALAIQAMGKS
jgi:hypothetical protein